ncbi:hypothetical protein TFUB22_00370 [Tannerella forsythia]|nr:hypothetical protein TFUB22_00370 [Tannerella forsythia]
MRVYGQRDTFGHFNQFNRHRTVFIFRHLNAVFVANRITRRNFKTFYQTFLFSGLQRASGLFFFHAERKVISRIHIMDTRSRLEGQPFDRRNHNLAGNLREGYIRCIFIGADIYTVFDDAIHP